MNAVVNFRVAEELRDRLPEKKAPKKLSALTGKRFGITITLNVRAV